MLHWLYFAPNLARLNCIKSFQRHRSNEWCKVRKTPNLAFLFFSEGGTRVSCMRTCPAAPSAEGMLWFYHAIIVRSYHLFLTWENGLNLLFSTELSAAFPQRFFRLCMCPLKEASLHLRRGLSPFCFFFLYPQSISTISVMWEVSPHLLLPYFHSYPLIWLSTIPISSRPVWPGCKCNWSF